MPAEKCKVSKIFQQVLFLFDFVQKVFELYEISCVILHTCVFSVHLTMFLFHKLIADAWKLTARSRKLRAKFAAGIRNICTAQQVLRRRQPEIHCADGALVRNIVMRCLHCDKRSCWHRRARPEFAF